MSVLRTEPTAWGSWNARVTSDGAPVTRLDISFWKSRGHFEVEGQSFTVEPDGFWLQNAALKRGSAVIARAEKPSFWRRRFVITSAGHRLTLESRSWTGREYVLLLGGQEVGWVKREGFGGRKATLDFPDEVPLVLRVLLLYLVLVQAKREAAAAASGS